MSVSFVVAKPKSLALSAALTSLSRLLRPRPHARPLSLGVSAPGRRGLARRCVGRRRRSRSGLAQHDIFHDSRIAHGNLDPLNEHLHAVLFNRDVPRAVGASCLRVGAYVAHGVRRLPASYRLQAGARPSAARVGLHRVFQGDITLVLEDHFGASDRFTVLIDHTPLKGAQAELCMGRNSRRQAECDTRADEG